MVIKKKKNALYSGSSGSESPCGSENVSSDESLEYESSDDEPSNDDTIEEEESENDSEMEEDIDTQIERTVSLSSEKKYVKVNNTSTCLKFSPTHNLLGVSTVNGDLEVFTYIDKSFTKMATIECYTESSCTGFDYSLDGNLIYGISPNSGFVVVDSNSEQIINFCDIDKSTHLTTITTINDSIVCTGDDRGNIKYWDVRYLNPLSQYQCFKFSKDDTNDYVSRIISHENEHLIATSSGAGIITVFDRRTLQILHQSAEAKADLTSLTCLGRNTLMASCLNGNFLFSSWDRNSDSCQLYEASNQISCNDLCSINDKNVISAWDDCFVRVYNLYPHKMLAVLGKQTLPPENLTVTPDCSLAVTDSFEKRMYIWDLKKINKINHRSRNTSVIIERDNFFENL